MPILVCEEGELSMNCLGHMKEYLHRLREAKAQEASKPLFKSISSTEMDSPELGDYFIACREWQASYMRALEPTEDAYAFMYAVQRAQKRGV